MNKGFTCIIKDEFDNVIMEGVVTRYCITAGPLIARVDDFGISEFIENITLKFSVEALQFNSIKSENFVTNTYERQCLHEWTEYKGLEEQYEYCVKCGDKK